jgi:hypothetical protein
MEQMLNFTKWFVSVNEPKPRKPNKQEKLHRRITYLHKHIQSVKNLMMNYDEFFETTIKNVDDFIPHKYNYISIDEYILDKPLKYREYRTYEECKHLLHILVDELEQANAKLLEI